MCRRTIFSIEGNEQDLNEYISQISQFKNIENINYVICDIPLAIIIAYQRLKKSFPNKKISTLFDINDEKELKKKVKEIETELDKNLFKKYNNVKKSSQLKGTQTWAPIHSIIERVELPNVEFLPFLSVNGVITFYCF